MKNNVTATMSNEELVNLGRAMTHHGFSSLDDFLRWAAQQQTAAILSEK